jgi:hypothetical protein
MRKSLYLIIIVLVFFIAGCSTIHVSGSGSAGGVRGSGGVDIPIPQKAK